MKITDLAIDRFGVWHGLRLEEMSDRLTVLYGPNEAGKTTLLQFIRGMLYGFDDERRRGYLLAWPGQAAGGRMQLSDPSGDVTLRRVAVAGAGGAIDERLEIRTEDGRLLADGALAALVGQTDEATFNNVFAVGMRELQELGTLADTDAARHLYRLTAGLDRVSLVEVMRELSASRNRILAADDRPSQVAHLVSERQRLEREIDELGSLTRDYERAWRERDTLSREVESLESDVARLEAEVRHIEAAIKIEGRWRERAAIDARLASLEPAPPLPKRAIERLTAVDAAIAARRTRLTELRRDAERTSAELEALPIQESLWRQGMRIEALADQSQWAESLEKQVASLATEVERLTAEVTGHHEHLGLKSDTPAELPMPWSDRSLASLRPAARAVVEARRQCRQAASALERERAKIATAVVELQSALHDVPDTDLTATHARAGELVSQLRRRVQLDERVHQLHEQHREFGARHRKLLDRQLMPTWVLAGLGIVFVFGVALILSGLFMPVTITGPLGWALALLGLGGAFVAAVVKWTMERSVSRQLEACEKQVQVLESQVRQAKEERDALDARLPQGGGPLVARLQEAERELAAIEALLPLEAGRRTAAENVRAAEERLADGRASLLAAKRRWRAELAHAGLPSDFSPRRLRDLANRRELIADARGRLALRRQELEVHSRGLARLSDRVDELAAEAGTVTGGGSIVERIARLKSAWSEQESLVARRDELSATVSKLRREQRRVVLLGRRLARRRSDLLRAAGARNVQELRRWADTIDEIAHLRKEREALEREIALAVGNDDRSAAVRLLLGEATAAELERRWDDRTAELGRHEAQLKALYERRGQLNQQLATLAADRRPAEKRLQHASLGRRLRDAVRRWQVLATTSRLLEKVRHTYETERQPEALREASHYLAELTGGRYARVWTPLGEDVLRVDSAAGRALPVEALSRGTREQLFLSLRLALAGSYARRGVRLPVVLDDLLVNFDAERAKAAATVLRDFAAGGHQLIVLTCHEHISKLFRTLKVDVRKLPEHADADLVSPPHETVAPPAPKRRSVAARRPMQTDAEVAPAPLVAASPAFFEDDLEGNADWLSTTKPATPVEPAQQPAAATAHPEEPESDKVELRGRSIWTAEGAEDFAGEFTERVVDRFVRQGWGSPDESVADSTPDAPLANEPDGEPDGADQPGATRDMADFDAWDERNASDEEESDSVPGEFDDADDVVNDALLDAARYDEEARAHVAESDDEAEAA